MGGRGGRGSERQREREGERQRDGERECVCVREREREGERGCVGERTSRVKIAGVEPVTQRALSLSLSLLEPVKQ